VHRSVFHGLSPVELSRIRACEFGIGLLFSSKLFEASDYLTCEMNDELVVDYLGPVDNATRQRLGQLLWHWTLCGQCTAKPSCAQRTCPWSQANGFDAFWSLYEKLTNAYCPDRLGRRAALKSHTELLDAVQKFKVGHATPRRRLLREIFEDGCTEGEKPPTLHDQNRAFNIGASITLLMDFGILHDAANVSSGSICNAAWRDGMSADAFVNEVFPRGSMSSDVRGVLADLNAKKLTKYAKLRLKATNDIRRHLVLDLKERVVWIFHHSTVLRETLLATANDTIICGLPREVILEVLDTIHKVLFPPDLGSQKLLAYLVVKNGWDKGLLSDMSTSYRDDNDPDISYAYFGDRLEELHRELQTPTPHGWLQRRLKRKSETYMLMATMYGVIIAVTLGFLSLVAAVFQAWVAWQQWQHPVK
jgi:hypothetical protein